MEEYCVFCEGNLRIRRLMANFTEKIRETTVDGKFSDEK